MKLTQYTDYSLRVLMYLGGKPDEKVQIDEIAEFYHISKNHLMKVVNHLANLGYVKTMRGRGGGIMLNYKPQDLKLGDIVRNTEDNFHMAECFREDNECVLTKICGLTPILSSALNAYLSTLDQYTLEDIVPKALSR
jgi:Rrf2 family nitric oxide-sensitive transcriptional repressor